MCRILSGRAYQAQIAEPFGDFTVLDSQADARIMSKCDAILSQQIIFRSLVFRRHLADYLPSVHKSRRRLPRVIGTIGIAGMDTPNQGSIAKVNCGAILISRGILWNTGKNAGQTFRVIGTVRVFDSIYL